MVLPHQHTEAKRVELVESSRLAGRPSQQSATRAQNVKINTFGQLSIPLTPFSGEKLTGKSITSAQNLSSLPD